MASDGEKERIKLRANWLNAISIAFFAIGALAPATQFVLTANASQQEANNFLALGLCCFVASCGLHLIAQRVLRQLDR